MDLRSVTGLTISAGNVNKISIGGVVYWKKNNDGRYKLLKESRIIGRTTITDLIGKVQDGFAQTDYGIGVQIIIPYHDPWDNNDYDLPFNFGTFTAYGEGKLGLQAHYAIPSKGITHGKATWQNYCSWQSSYAYKWLNAYDTEYSLTDSDTEYNGKIGFMGCLPEDFIGAMNTTSHNLTGETLVSSKIFLPSATNMSAQTGSSIMHTIHYNIAATIGDGEDSVWEYWQKRMGGIQLYYDYENTTAMTARISYKISDAASSAEILLPNSIARSSNVSHAGFTKEGMYFNLACNGKYFYLPACVIG